MADGLGRESILFIPRACPLMQARYLLRLRLHQVRLQHIGEKVMITIPLALVVQRHDKEVAPLQGL